jgi:membrane-bound metal-dependent hydrolase YbcI (DUF457 family)
MDPITHGIAGALIGKGYFAERYGRVATFAAVLGAIAPDIDVVSGIITRDPLSIVKYHRAITHSFVALPVFALLLALLIRAFLPWLKRKWRWLKDAESPSLLMLTLICAVGLASHILLDGMTSFGTRMWFPLSNKRVAWDLLFIVDFAFTAIILLPQTIAWIYSDPMPNQSAARDVARSRRLAIRMWVIFVVVTFVVWALARLAGYPFRLPVAVIVAVILAVVLFAPAIRDWGYHVTQAGWCQFGVCLMIAYLLGCALAHHVAILRVKTFADQNHITVERMGALPIPPSLLDWGDAIRSPDGVFESEFDLRNTGPLVFRFIPDSPADTYIARALRYPNAKLFLGFSRFPSIVSFEDQQGRHIVQLGQNRFADKRRGPQPFTYQMVFDREGDLVDQGWLTEGMVQAQLRQLVPQPPLPAKTKTKAPED